MRNWLPFSKVLYLVAVYGNYIQNTFYREDIFFKKLATVLQSPYLVAVYGKYRRALT
jgi:hypothetical protein